MNSAKRVRHLKKILLVENFLSPEKIGPRIFSYGEQRNLTQRAAVNAKEEYVIKSILSDPVIPNVSFMEMLWRHSANFRKHVAVECAETRKSYTYEQLWTHIGRFATSLHNKLGVRSGDIVAAMMPNCPEYPIVALGTLQIGATLTTINPIYKELEITHQLKLTAPKIIVTVTECYKTITNALKQINADAKIVIVAKPNEPIPDDCIRFSEIGEQGDVDYKLLESIKTKKNDIALLPFSSGTTGLPKGVEISNYNLMAALDTMQDERVGLPKLTSGDFQDVVPCVLPFFHIYGLVVTMIGHLAMGCKLISVPKFSTNLYLDILKNDKASLLYVVPPIAILLSKHPDVKEEHIRSVRHLLCGAAPLAASDIEPLLEKSKGKLSFCQGYGSTETTSITTSTLHGCNPDMSAAGVPLGGIEMKFVDPFNGTPLPVGVEGELLVRGPTVMRGYYKNGKATKDCITEDGYFRTGDLGYYKPGFGLYITDRIKELIKVKGMQVAPAELESLLRSHPAVQEAAVIGIPNEISGEVPKAFIIAKNGTSTNEEELQDFVAKQVAVFKKIQEVQFVSEIPKTASGKILRRELKKMYV